MKTSVQIAIFLLIVLAVTGVLGYSSYIKWKKNNPDGTLKTFFNGKDMTSKSILVGMASGLIFGFIDNFGLFMGMSVLDPLLKKLPFAKDPNVFAGYGNTFSDLIGAFLGTFGGLLIAESYKTYEYPIWAEALGIFIGCLVGILVGKSVSMKHKLSK